MNKILPIVAVCILIVSCKKEKAVVVEDPEQKEVTYHIFAAKNYAGTSVENVKAELRLQLRIINYRTGEQQVVWDSLLPVRRLIDFPQYNQKIIVQRTYPVLNSHQKLNGSYSVIYRDGQAISQAGHSEEAGPGTKSILLEADM